MPPIAAVTGAPWVEVNYPDFLLRWWSVSVWLVLLTVLLRRRGLLRPRHAPIVSWENWLYCLTRWPFIAWGWARPRRRGSAAADHLQGHPEEHRRARHRCPRGSWSRSSRSASCWRAARWPAS